MSATAIKSVRRGKSIPERQSLWSFAGTASEIKNKRAQRPLDNVLTGPIDKSQIKIFEKPLPGSGYIFKTLADGKTFDIPFDVEGPGSDFYKFGITPSPLYLISRCECPREDLDRTTVGVAEQVYLYWSASLEGTNFPNGICPSDGVECEPITWETSAGSLSSSNTWQTTFTAPSNQTDTVTVTANVRDEKCKIEFEVVEPSGVDHADMISTLYQYTVGRAGAKMHIRPYLNPTNVSFYRVEIMEVGEDADPVTGYFTQFSTQFLRHNTADQWFGINCDNSWKEPWDLAGSAEFNGPWSGGGGFHWNIPWKWRVIGSGTVHEMGNGWSQDFSMDANGTFTVEKFDRSVVRPINQPYGTPH